MNNRKRIALISVAFLVAAVAGYYFLEFRPAQERLAGVIADALMKARPLPSVDLKAWKRLKVGMTKPQVQYLLGQAPSQQASNRADRRLTAQPDPKAVEFWEYGYTYGVLAPVAHPQAYVVYFDEKGRVTAFRGPRRGG